MLVGYARVSTEEQNEARQMEMFEAMGIEPKNIFLDKLSGKNTNRPQLKEMIAFVRRGDIVITESISRLARNTKDLLSIVEQINAKGAEYKSVKESIDTTTATGKFMLTVFAAMAELERDTIRQRQREGISIAKAEGKYTGRVKIEFDEDKLRRECKKWREGKQTAVDTMKKMGMKTNTFYRRVKELGL